MPQIVHCAAWLPTAGRYIKFERYYDDTGASAGLAQGVFHCVNGHEVSPQSANDQRRLVSCLTLCFDTGVGRIAVMPEDQCPTCRRAKGLAPYPPGAAHTNLDPPADERGCA